MRVEKKASFLLLAAVLLLGGCGRTQEVKENTVTMESQKLEVTGIANARELGGYHTGDGTVIKRGLLLRTAELGTATEKERQELEEKYPIAHVIDMRSSTEIASKPEPSLPSVMYHSVKIMNEKQMKECLAPYMDQLKNPETTALERLEIYVDSGITSDQIYVDYLKDEQGRQGFREFFRILLENEEGKAVLWHCTNGKDRTGVSAMLLLSVLNVDEETIRRDFLLTNDFFADEIAAVRSELEPVVKDEKRLEDMLVASRGVSERYLDNAISYLKDNYGSPVEYVKKELGLTEEDIRILKEKYTEK